MLSILWFVGERKKIRDVGLCAPEVVLISPTELLMVLELAVVGFKYSTWIGLDTG